MRPRQAVASVPFAIHAGSASEANGPLALDIEQRTASAMCAAARAASGRSVLTNGSATAVMVEAEQDGHQACAEQDPQSACYAVVQPGESGQFRSDLNCDGIGSTGGGYYACCDDALTDASIRVIASKTHSVPPVATGHGEKVFCPVSHPIPITGSCSPGSSNLLLIGSLGHNWDNPSAWAGQSEAKRAGWECIYNNTHGSTAYTFSVKIVCSSGK